MSLWNYIRLILVGMCFAFAIMCTIGASISIDVIGIIMGAILCITCILLMILFISETKNEQEIKIIMANEIGKLFALEDAIRCCEVAKKDDDADEQEE